MKKILYLSIMSCSITPMQHYPILNNSDLKKVLIKAPSVFIPQQLGNIELYHDNNGFSIDKESKSFPIQRCFMNKELRGISTENLARLLAANAYLSVQKINKHEYTLKLNGRLHGGGVIGATIGAFLGKAAVYVAGHGAIQIIGFLTGPAYPVTVLALEGCFAIPIETASMAGAVAGGMALGVATGPV